MRILLVEGSPTTRLSTGALLRSRGHEVYLAVDGEHGARLFRELDLDLVIMDVVMPKLGGVEAIRLMREAKPGVPVIGYTGELEAAKRAGVDELFDARMLKPFTPAELERALESCK